MIKVRIVVTVRKSERRMGNGKYKAAGSSKVIDKVLFLHLGDNCKGICLIIRAIYSFYTIICIWLILQ